MLKKLDLYVYFSQKGVHIERTFLIKEDGSLEKYNEMWGVKSIIKKEFHGEPVYNEQYLKTKIKSYKRQINTKFHNNKIPKEGLQFIF